MQCAFNRSCWCQWVNTKLFFGSIIGWVCFFLARSWRTSFLHLCPVLLNSVCDCFLLCLHGLSLFHCFPSHYGKTPENLVLVARVSHCRDSPPRHNNLVLKLLKLPEIFTIVALSLTLTVEISSLMTLQVLPNIEYHQNRIELCVRALRHNPMKRVYLFRPFHFAWERFSYSFQFRNRGVFKWHRSKCRKCMLCIGYLSDDWRL